jgi:Domain of unknown function (DUF4115)
VPSIGRGDAEAPDSLNQRAEIDEASSTKETPTRDTRFVSLTDLERVADEAADIDSIVRTELERVGQPRAFDAPPTSDDGARSRAARRRRSRWPILVSLVVLLAVGGLAAVLGGDRSATSTRTAAASPSGVVAPATVKPTPTPTATPSSGAVTSILARLSIADRCWVRAVADGQTVFTGTLIDGSRTFRADRSLFLTLGNAGGARVEVDGRTVPTGATGEVVDLSFVVRGKRLVQLPT